MDIGKLLNWSMKGITLVLVGGILVKTMFFEKQVPAYPDYSRLLERIEKDLNSKLDSLGVNIGRVSIKIDESKKKETGLVKMYSDIKKEKQDELKTIDVVITTDTISDKQRDKSRDEVLGE